MIGVGGIVGTIFLLLITIVLACVGAGILVAFILFLFRREKILAVIALLVGSLFVAPLILVMLKSSEMKTRGLDVEAIIPKDTKGFRIHPDAYVRDVDSQISQALWGELRLDIDLPNGGTIKGASKRITLITTQDGDFARLQIFYEPDMSFYDATSINDVFNYWKSRGRVIVDFPGSLQVDCGLYILRIGNISDSITFSVEATPIKANPKEPEPE